MQYEQYEGANASAPLAALGEEDLLPPNVELVHGDALRLDLEAYLEDAPASVRVVANLPYSAATPLLRRMLDLRHRLTDWSVMLHSFGEPRLAVISIHFTEKLK